MVELQGAGWRAGGRPIVEGVSLRFRPGKFNVLLGPNGAGKTTLLRLATGLLRPSEGRVLLGDRDVCAIPPGELARARAVLSQHVELAFPLSAEDVALMGRYPHYRRVPTAADREIVREALAGVGMLEQRRQPYPTLSGGEKQKVQLARVLAQIWQPAERPEPRLLFLDEPTTSLDVHYQIHLLDVARGLLARNCTVVAILHDINVACHYGDCFFVLDRGRLVEVADRAADLSPALLERVFRVKARALPDPEGGEGLWKFSLD